MTRIQPAYHHGHARRRAPSFGMIRVNARFYHLAVTSFGCVARLAPEMLTLYVLGHNLAIQEQSWNTEIEGLRQRTSDWRNEYHRQLVCCEGDDTWDRVVDLLSNNGLELNTLTIDPSRDPTLAVDRE
jgi:hypothetical protein